MDRAVLIDVLGRLPVAGKLLRAYARRYAEGSVTTIRTGRAAGLQWRRSHRYVNGYWLGQYELPIQDALARELKPNDTFYDVGANAGFFTLIAARIVGRNGKCIAFDPSPENVQNIREQLELNGFDGAEVHQEAIADRAGIVAFSFAAPGSAQGHLGAAAAGEQSMDVNVTTLDAVARERGAPSLVKMDIEGAEVRALEGAANVLRDVRPTWLIELHGPDCARRVGEILSGAGYGFHDLSGRALPPGDDLPHHVIARHRAAATGPVLPPPVALAGGNAPERGRS